MCFVGSIQLELVLSAGTVVMALYAAVAGIFGMNIPYTWNDGHDYVFKWVMIFYVKFCCHSPLDRHILLDLTEES